MSVISLDETDISLYARDDGKIGVEFRAREEDGAYLVAIFSITAETAVGFGEILVGKGRNLLDLLEAQNDSATAWRDVNGKIWYGEQGSDRMHPKDADTDEADHSWIELLASYGPLTPVNA